MDMDRARINPNCYFIPNIHPGPIIGVEMSEIGPDVVNLEYGR